MGPVHCGECPPQTGAHGLYKKATWKPWEESQWISVSTISVSRLVCLNDGQWQQGKPNLTFPASICSLPRCVSQEWIENCDKLANTESKLGHPPEKPETQQNRKASSIQTVCYVEDSCVVLFRATLRVGNGIITSHIVSDLMGGQVSLCDHILGALMYGRQNSHFLGNVPISLTYCYIWSQF